MTILLLTLVILASAVATGRAVVHDGRGQAPPPNSHHVDADFLPPAGLYPRR